MRADLLGIPVDILSSEETLHAVDRAISSRSRLQHVALNVAKLVSLRSNAELHEDVVSSDIVGIDGMGIVLALRLMGYPHAGRVAGIDLLEQSLRLCAEKGYRPFFLGARADVLAKAVANAKARYPDLRFAGWRDGYFSADQQDDVLREIQSAGADCLFIGMPTPRKERLLAGWRHKLDVPFIMGVGGSFDVLAGKVERAPLWMQRNGLEWAYRIYQEPSRMWWRYLKTNTLFAALLMQLAMARLLGRGRRSTAS